MYQGRQAKGMSKGARRAGKRSGTTRATFSCIVV